MRNILLAAALLAAAPAFAGDLIGRQGDDSVRLTEAPCENLQIVVLIEIVHGGYASDYRAASAVFQGQPFQACWRMMGNAAYLVYEDGDQGIVPAHELKPAVDI